MSLAKRITKTKSVRTDTPQFARDAKAFDVLLQNRHRKPCVGHSVAGAAFACEQCNNSRQALGPIAWMIGVESTMGSPQSMMQF
ncbi:hypothetical protein OKW47_006599 [Paraburkholderia atlantica]